MGSKLHELETSEMKLEEIHEADGSPVEQDQQGQDLRSKRFGPEGSSPRYELRTSNKNEMWPNVSAKRRVESPLPGGPSTKRRRMPMPTPTLDDSGEKRTILAKKLRQRRQQIGSNSPEVSFQEVSVGEADFFRLINRRIQVYWNMDEAWYTGLLKRYDPTNKLHLVVYDDGEDEWVSLERDKVKIQILVPGEFITIPNSGIGQSKRDELDNRSLEHTRQGDIKCLQQVGTNFLQDSGIDSSQKKTSRRKVLREERKDGMDAVGSSQKKTTRKNVLKEQKDGIEQKNGMEAIENSQKKKTRKIVLKEEKKDGSDVSEKRTSERGKQVHGIDGRRVQQARSITDIRQQLKPANEDRKNPIASVSNHSRSIDGSRVQHARFMTDVSQQLKPSNEDRRSPIASVSIRSSSSANNGDTVSREASLSHRALAKVYRRRSRPKSSVNVNSESGGRDLGSHKVAGNAYVYRHHENLVHGVDDTSTRPSSSGTGETCIGSRGNEHAAIGELGDPSNMNLEKVPMNAEGCNSSKNLKTNIENTSGVGETSMGSRGDEHPAMGSSALVDHRDMELERAPMYAEFQNCPKNLKGNISNASGVGETCVRSRGDDHAAFGASVLADCSDMGLEKAAMNSEFQNCPQNLKTNIDNVNVIVSTSSSRLDDCTRSKAGQENCLEAATSAADKTSVTYVRKRRRKANCTESSEFPAKRVRKLNLEETAVFPDFKGKEINPVHMMFCRGIHGEGESVISRSSSSDMIPNDRFNKDVSDFGDDTSCSANLKLVLVSNFRFPEGKVHMSPLYIREPSYWQCIASGLQLFKVCPVNISRSAKLLSWENLFVFIGTMFRFLNAGSEPSSSLCNTQMKLEQFEAVDLLNARKYTELPLWKCSQSMIMRSDVQVELLVFDTLSNAHKFYFWGPFSEVLCNVGMSLASLMSSATNLFPGEMFGAARPANLNAPIQSLTVKFSSLQRGAWSPLICSFENLHNMARENWNDGKRTLHWFDSSFKTLIQGESSKSNLGNLGCSSNLMDYRGKALVRGGDHCKYKQGTEAVNVLKRILENRHLTSSLFQRFNIQNVSAVSMNQSKKPLGRIVRCHQPVPSMSTTFVDSPNFFQYLHLNLLFGKAFHPDCSQSHGALPSEEVPNEPTRKRKLSIHMPELVSGDVYLKADKWSAAKRLTLEDHNCPTVNDTPEPSSALSSGFDVNVTGISSEVPSRQMSLVPVLPILKFQRPSTNQRSWHIDERSLPSSFKGTASRHTAHEVSLHSHHIEPEKTRGHFVYQNQREYNLLQSGAAYGGHMESSQSGYSLSISDNADDIMLKSERPGRRSRPSRRDKKQRYKDAELDSQTCDTNILIFGRGESWRETGAEVALEALSLNEWVLNVKLDGCTKFRYKAQEEKIRRAHEQRLPKAGEQTLSYPNFRPITWSGGKNWGLEFTERKQWSLFKKMYEECYSKNLRAASIKNIPIPTVREIDVDNLATVRIPFRRPINYIKIEDDEVNRALFGGRVVYDMDSDDEKWLGRFNSTDADYDSRAYEVSEDTFEGILDMLEKAAFMRECDLTVDDAIDLCSELAPVKDLTLIHSYWLGKRKKAGKALIREFQTSPPKRRKPGGKSLRGKTFRGQHKVTSGKSLIGKPCARNWDAGASTEMQLQHHGLTSGSEGSSDTVGLVFNANVEAAMEAARAAREIAIAKRQRAQYLFQVADMKMYKAVTASRNAEALRVVEQARLLSCQASQHFPNDSKIIENANASRLSF